jgi:hypothetical protein
MQKRETPTYLKPRTKLRFHPSRDVKLIVGRSSLTLTVKHKEKEIEKYIDAVLDRLAADPSVTDFVDFNQNEPLPTYAPARELAVALLALIASSVERQNRVHRKQIEGTARCQAILESDQ